MSISPICQLLTLTAFKAEAIGLARAILNILN